MKGESFVDGLTKILVKREVIPEKEARNLRKAFKDSEKANFDEFLLDEGLVDKDDLLPALADLYQVPAFDAVGYFFDHELVRTFPKEFLLSNAIIPIELDENMLIFVASNPLDPELLPRIGEYVSYDLRFDVGIRQDIVNAIQEYYDQSPVEVNPELDEDIEETDELRQQGIRQGQRIEEMYEEDIEKKSE